MRTRTMLLEEARVHFMTEAFKIVMVVAHKLVYILSEDKNVKGDNHLSNTDNHSLVPVYNEYPSFCLLQPHPAPFSHGSH